MKLYVKKHCCGIDNETMEETNFESIQDFDLKKMGHPIKFGDYEAPLKYFPPYILDEDDYDIPGGLLHEHQPFGVLMINYYSVPMESWCDFCIHGNDEFWLTDDNNRITFHGNSPEDLEVLYNNLKITVTLDSI